MAGIFYALNVPYGAITPLAKDLIVQSSQQDYKHKVQYNFLWALYFVFTTTIFYNEFINEIGTILFHIHTVFCLPQCYRIVIFFMTKQINFYVFCQFDNVVLKV